MSEPCYDCGDKDSLTGPWEEDGKPTVMLCGPCKANRALATPGFKERLERDIRRAMRYVVDK